MTSTPIAAEFDADLLHILVCPRHLLPLTQEDSSLVCAGGDSYAIVEGIPILLLSDALQTHIEGTRSLEVASQGAAATLPQFNIASGDIDPFVQNAIGATNGSLYQHLVGNMKEYPIPRLRLPAGNGRLFLEIGCSWGRWCIAAARQGYRPVGIDPSLKGIRAARRVAAQLGVQAHYIVADGRHLPFAGETFSHVFSYSVLQHVSRNNVLKTLPEIRRVLRSSGESLIQMPNVFGVRCLYHQLRRNFREAHDFEVRYWTPHELESAFTSGVGPSRISVDGFFSLNAQASDLRFLPPRYRALVQLSEFLRRASRRIPSLAYVADSLYVSSTKDGNKNQPDSPCTSTVNSPLASSLPFPAIAPRGRAS